MSRLPGFAKHECLSSFLRSRLFGLFLALSNSRSLTEKGWRRWKHRRLFPLSTAIKSESVQKGLWRSDRDSNPGDGLPPTHFPGVRLRPLGHRSVAALFTEF